MDKVFNNKDLFTDILDSSKDNTKSLKLVLEDNISIKNLGLEIGSKILEGFVSPYDSSIVEKLMNNNYPIVGKSKVDEFGIIKNNESKRNLLDILNLGLADLGIGVETKVDLMLKGIKDHYISFLPSRESISYYGIATSSSNFSRLSITSKNLKSIREIYDVIKGQDIRDLNTHNDLAQDIDLKDIKTFRLEDSEYSDEIINILDRDSQTLGLSYEKYIISSFKAIFAADISSNLSKYDGLRYGFRAEQYIDFDDMYSKTRSLAFSDQIKKLIITGNYLLSMDKLDDYYNKSVLVKNKTKEELDKILDDKSFIILPISSRETEDLAIYLANFANLPALSIPISNSEAILILARNLNDNNLLKVAEYIEERINEI